MFSNRLDTIKPFTVMEVLARALEMDEAGMDITHMEIGEPDFDTPNRIIKGCYNDIVEGKTHYTHSQGYIALREAIADYKLKSRNIKIDPKTQIMITGGTSPAFFNIMSSIINSGDEVIITDPGYPCYENYIRFFEGKPVPIPIYEKNKFDLEIERVKESITSKTKAIILNSPSNPTGQIISRPNLKEISELVVEHDFWVISDEIYAELTYDGKIAPSLGEQEFNECHNRLLILDGFSKFWAMTGWRLGYIIASEEFIKKIMPIQQNFSICAPSISQAAAVHALKCEEETQEMLNIYKERRDYIVKRINEMRGISCLVPRGAFYVFANIKELKIKSMEFSFKLLEEAQVATTPGSSFGENGEGYIRFSYATDIENIKKGMDKLETFLESKF